MTDTKQQPVQMTITIEENGSVTVAGPLASPVLAYGLLEAAREVVRDFQRQQAEQRARQQLMLPNGRLGNLRQNG